MSPVRGGQLVLTATGFKPGTAVEFWIHSTPIRLGTVTDDHDGRAVFRAVLDPALTGSHIVYAVGTDPAGLPRTLSQHITIADAPVTQLAATGVGLGGALMLTVLLLVGGCLLIGASRTITCRAAEH